jgi:hypothetical protein
MFNFSTGKHTIFCQSEGLPFLYRAYCAHARLVEEVELDKYPDICFFAVAENSDDWPFLTVAQSYSPSSLGGFYPGALLIEDTNRLFLGAGERLLAYDLSAPVRLWQDAADCGFSRWSRYGDYVVMSAEIELAVWDNAGQKLWTSFVEPPWNYSVNDGVVELAVMGKVSHFDLRTGPPRI